MKKIKKDEFDLKKVYTHILSKERIIELIGNCYDKEFIITFLPRTKDNADMLIRSLKLDCSKKIKKVKGGKK